MSACSLAAASNGSVGVPSGVVKSSATRQVSLASVRSVGAKPSKYRPSTRAFTDSKFTALYVVPWLPALPIAGQALLQPYTVVLVAIGTYQLWLAGRELTGRVNGGLARASGYASSSA